MKAMQMYLVGYVMVLGGLVAALWKPGRSRVDQAGLDSGKEEVFSMRRLNQFMFLLTMIVGGAAFVLPAGADDVAPTYTNVQVMSIDAIGRKLVIRKEKGAEETVALDDNVAGFGDVKVGDRVILTLRTGPGWARITSIVKSNALPAPKVATVVLPAARVVDDSQVVASRQAFGVQVASFAGQADQVDRVWNQFRGACDFKPGNQHEGARGWFVLWEGSIRADMSGGFCRDLFNQIVNLGEPIKAGMSAAEDVALRTLTPGDIAQIRRQYTLDWDGWTLASPKQLEP